MNDSAYINVYHTINPGKFYSYGTYISKVCFGLVPGTTDEYSFISNPITGHFIYKVSSKYLMPSSNPQNESEARNCLAEILSNLRDKISAAKNSKSLPEDFPVLFNNSHISTMNIAPVYDGQNTNIITSWKAVLGIELKVFNSLKRAKSMLESDSIIIEFSGKRIIEMDYNYTPIVKREEVPIRPNENSEFILKKVNANTIAPYYLTADGYIPACSKSVPVLQKPVSFGWSSPQPTHDSSKSMLTLSDIVEPTEDHPGSAKLVISMDYKVVTTGEGAVNLDIIDSSKFFQLYKLGNLPGEKEKNPLLLKRLPTNENMAVILSDNEMEKIDKKDLSFNNYYKVNIEYEYNLKVETNCSLWNAFKWMYDFKYSRGLICLVPFEKEFKDFYNVKKTYYKNKNFKAKVKINDARCRILTKFAIYLLENIIVDNLEYYRNRDIYDSNAFYMIDQNAICNDIEFNRLLQSINSSFHCNEICDNNCFTINNLNDMYSILCQFSDLISDSIINIYEKKAAGVGCIGHPNCIGLSPYFFGKNGSYSNKGSTFSLTPMEVLAHEAGHNSAKAFFHTESKDGDYEYDQIGLQSNEEGNVYPTYNNTIGIIQDEDNVKHMNVIK